MHGDEFLPNACAGWFPAEVWNELQQLAQAEIEAQLSSRWDLHTIIVYVRMAHLLASSMRVPNSQ
jgi:hypothetical protein